MFSKLLAPKIIKKMVLTCHILVHFGTQRWDCKQILLDPQNGCGVDM